MDILVISACSKSKRHDPIVEQPAIDADTRIELLNGDIEHTATAEALYTGREHEHVTAAVEELRRFATVDWHIVSAGFGLVNHETLLPAYEATFSGQSKVDLVNRAEQLDINPDGRTKDELLQAIGVAKDIPDDILALDLASYDYFAVRNRMRENWISSLLWQWSFFESPGLFRLIQMFPHQMPSRSPIASRRYYSHCPFRLL